MAEKYTGMAIGIFELDNLVACYVAADVATKTADVKIQGIERNRLKAGACVKLRGSVAEIQAAMDAALAAAAPLADIVSHTVIASPAPDAEIAIAMTIQK